MGKGECTYPAEQFKKSVRLLNSLCHIAQILL